MKQNPSQDVVSEVQTQLTENGPLNVTPTQFPVDTATLDDAKKAREARMGLESNLSISSDGIKLGSYMQRMWRQDSATEGLMAHIAGSEMMPDGSYSPFEPKEWKDLTAGIPDEFHKEFYKAHSAAHARYLRDLINQKLEDQAHLGDLGVPGNIGRVLMGFVSPENLALSVVSGGLAGSVKNVAIAGQRIKQAREIANAASRAGALEEGMGGLADAASKLGSKSAAAVGIGSAAVENVAQEKLRQQFNFENDSSQVLDAGLVGMAFASPFVGLHIRHMNKLRTVAAEEREALSAAHKALNGERLSESEQATLTAAESRLRDVYNIETGKVDPTDVPSAHFITNAELRRRNGKGNKERGLINMDALGSEVAFHGEDGGLRSGSVVGKEGEHLHIDTMPDQPAHVMHEDRFHTVHPSDLHPESPHYRDPGYTLKDGSRVNVEKTAEGKPRTQAQSELGELLHTPNPGDFYLHAKDDNGNVMGWLSLSHLGDGKVEPKDVTVLKEHRRKGVASAMYEHARKLGYEVVESPYQTADGKALRSSMQKRNSPTADNDLDFTHLADEPPTSFHGNSVGAAQGTGLSHDPGQSSTAFAKARLDIFSKLNKSTNSVIRSLGFRMVKDPIQTDKYVAQGWTATERKRNTQRVLGGLFHRDARDAFDEAAKARGMGPVKKAQFHREFYENVSKVARGDVDVIIANQDIAPQLQKAAAAMRNVFDTMADKMLKSGVQGAENLKTGGQYVNRVWNHNNIRKAIQTFGENEVVRVLANAIQVPGLQGDVAKAKTFLTAVKKLEFNHTLPDMQLYAHDAVALRKELAAAGLQPYEVESVVDVMFHQKKSEGDAGNAGNLKYRFDIDENYSEHINGQEMKVSDLFENDSRVLVDKYLNSMAGHDALAGMGFKSRADFMRELAKADEEHLANSSATTDASRFNEEKQLLLDMYHYTTGRPMSTQTFNRVDRVVGAFRAYTRSAMLGQLGVAASFEMFNAVGMTTMRAFWQQVPSFSGLIRQLRTGRIANAKLAQDVENMIGAGLESASSYARQHELTEFTYDRGLTQFEDGMNKASHVVDIISGNNHATSMTRQMAAAAFVQKHVNMAEGKLKLTDKLRERLVGQGIDDELIEPVLEDLNKFTTKAANGRVEEIHWENWQQQSPKTFDMYQLALQREVRDAIQDHDIGETMPWMHGTLGKIAAELRTFTYVAHAKQNLKNAHYRDSQALHTFTLTFMANALAYSLQTSANYAHDQTKLQEKLSLDKIAKGAIQRMSIMGITPTIFETAHWLATGRSFFQGGTTNTDNRNALMTPSMIQAQRLLGGAKTTVNALNPFASTTTTQKEARDLFSVMPGGNWFLMRNLNDAISSTFPKGEPKVAQ